MAYLLFCQFLHVCLLGFSSATLTLLHWLMCAWFSIITKRGEGTCIPEQTKSSHMTIFVSTASAIHHRQRVLPLPQHKNADGVRKKATQINSLQPAVRAFMWSALLDFSLTEFEMFSATLEVKKNVIYSDLSLQEYRQATVN